MYRKFSVFLFLLILISGSAFLSAQPKSGEKIAQLKFTLAEFRNPSNLRGRYGLLRFSNDGRLLATTGTERDVKIYSVETGQAVATIDSRKAGLGGKVGFNAFSFSPDGKFAIAQAEDLGSLRVFNTSNGNLVKVIDGRGKASSGKQMFLGIFKEVSGLEMNPVPIDDDWKNVLVAKNDGLLQIVDIESGAVKNDLKLASDSSVTWDFMKMAFQLYSPIPVRFLTSRGEFSSDGERIIVANGDKSPTLWNAETGEQIARLEPQTDRVYSAFFSPNGEFVVTSDINGIATVWDAEDGKRITSFGSKKDEVFPVSWNADSDAVITVSPKDDARVWDARTGNLRFTLEKSEASIASPSPDGDKIATINRDNKKQLAQIWNNSNGKLLATLPRGKDEDRAYSLVWSPNGELLVTASNNFVRIWSSDGKLLQTLDKAVYPARFSKDGKFLATGGKNDVGYVWQIGEN